MTNPPADETIPAPLATQVAEALGALESARAGARLWEKDFTLWKSDQQIGQHIQNRLGWLDSARALEPELRTLENFANEVRRQDFRHIVLLGMGGSSLTAQVLRTTFGNQPGFPELCVLDSTNPAAVLAVEQAIDVRQTLFVVASKSGTTQETLAQFHYFYNLLRAAKGEQAATQCFIAITDPGSALEASRFPFRQVFRNFPDIGGRFSALSYFGLVPATLMGIDVNALLDSALAMTTACGPDVPTRANPGLLLGAILGAAAKAGHDKLTLITSPAIASFGQWIEQLIAASTGKDGRGIVPILGEPLGAPAVYGTDRLFVYVRVDDDADPTQEAALAQLEAAGQPVVRLRLRNRYALGGECYRWEVATAIAGRLLTINPFDESDVQASKENTRRILGDFERQRRFTPPTPILTEGNVRVAATGALANALRGVNRLGAVSQAILSVAQPGDYLAMLAYLTPSAEIDTLLQQWRVALRDAGHLATTVGYGPRYLHSTGQLHKGGANNGIFLQLVGDVPDDLRIPDQRYTFGNLLHAQALGDYEALHSRGRRVARIELGPDARGALARIVV